MDIFIVIYDVEYQGESNTRLIMQKQKKKLT